MKLREASIAGVIRARKITFGMAKLDRTIAGMDSEFASLMSSDLPQQHCLDHLEMIDATSVVGRKKNKILLLLLFMTKRCKLWKKGEERGVLPIFLHLNLI